MPANDAIAHESTRTKTINPHTRLFVFVLIFVLIFVLDFRFSSPLFLLYIVFPFPLFPSPLTTFKLARFNVWPRPRTTDGQPFSFLL